MAMPVYFYSITALIVAGGKGVRFGNELPKQFQFLNGKLMIEYSLEAFNRNDSISSIIVVLPNEFLDSNWVKGWVDQFPKVNKIISGGASRFESVQNGVEQIESDDSFVLIHDAARPGITTQLIDRIIEKVTKEKVVLPVLKVVDTIKKVSEIQVIETIPREGITLAQTPQAFYLPILREAIKNSKMHQEDVTDEIQLIEKYTNHPIAFVEGAIQNMKITTPEDFQTVELLMNKPHHIRYRTGIGYDIHQLVEGRKLIIGGVEIASDLGLLGHSDADVLSHAIADALLGAASLGDIGIHFPNNNERFRNISSMKILESVRELLIQSKSSIENIDATLVLESPKILRYRDQMIQNISNALQISPNLISIKATTNEGLDAIGRKEGASAMAIATIRVEIR